MTSRALGVFLALVFPLALWGQTDSVDIQVAPAFPGGEQALYDYLYKNFRIPEAAYQSGVDGQVTASFVIEKDGSVSSVQIVKPLHPAVDAEMIRVVQAMPRWLPGHSNGNPVRVRFTLPMKVYAFQGPSPDLAVRRKGFDMDFHASFGDGFWTGTVGQYFQGPSLVYSCGFNFRLKSWRIGVDLLALNATLKTQRPLEGVLFPAGQKFVFGWLGFEIQRPLVWTDRLRFAPFASLHGTFQNPLHESRDPEFHLWGLGVHAGGLLDWTFARHLIDKGSSRLGHALRLRAGIAPRLAGQPDYRGALLNFSLGYCLQIRPYSQFVNKTPISR